MLGEGEEFVSSRQRLTTLRNYPLSVLSLDSSLPPLLCSPLLQGLWLYHLLSSTPPKSHQTFKAEPTVNAQKVFLGGLMEHRSGFMKEADLLLNQNELVLLKLLTFITLM